MSKIVTWRCRINVLGGIIWFVLASCVAQAADIRLVNSGNWTNITVWTPSVFPTTNDNVYVINASWRAGYTVVVDSAEARAKYLYLGHSVGGIGALEIQPGANFFLSNIYNGYGTDCTGSVVQTGGIITNTGSLRVGHLGYGTFLLAGGTHLCNAFYMNSRGTATQRAGRLETTEMVIGKNTSSVYYEISGGSMNVSDKGIKLGGLGNSRDCHFKVVGTNAVITTAEYLQTNSVLHVVLQEGGVSPIVVSGSPVIMANTELRLEVDPTRFVDNGANITVMTYGGTLTGQFSLTNVVTPDIFCDGIQYDTVGKAIRLLNVRYAPPGTMITVR